MTAAEQAELRAVSTRGRISASSFVNDYQWGYLKADPRDWMKRYFDVHLYLANWGIRRIALRLPASLLDPALAATYCAGRAAASLSTNEHVILDLRSEDEDSDEEWWEDEAALAAIVPVRAELAAGDARLLYLAWLLCVQNQELDEDSLEPAVPPGLGIRCRGRVAGRPAGTQRMRRSTQAEPAGPPGTRRAVRQHGRLSAA